MPVSNGSCRIELSYSPYNQRDWVVLIEVELPHLGRTIKGMLIEALEGLEK